MTQATTMYKSLVALQNMISKPESTAQEVKTQFIIQHEDMFNFKNKQVFEHTNYMLNRQIKKPYNHKLHVISFMKDLFFQVNPVSSQVEVETAAAKDPKSCLKVETFVKAR